MNDYGISLDKEFILAYLTSRISYPSFLTQNQKSYSFMKET